jgi:hypothetical protein
MAKIKRRNDKPRQLDARKEIKTQNWQQKQCGEH